MKIDGGHIINDFIEPNKRQYAIPVYQRNYEWSREQCEKLFEDIVLAYKKDRNHFCGSVVYAPLKEEHNIHYYVIVDGQQRLTTIYLLLKALIDCAETTGQKESITETVFNRDKFDTYDVDTASKLKLKPIKSDNQQLYLLMDDKYDKVDHSSGIWTNYTIFKDLITDELEKDHNLDVKMIYKGIEKLTCAMIKLDEEDNAQEIFERINSTGIPLSLADQIRNFVLMTDADQEQLYEEYWLKTEELVQRDQMSEFFLDYLNMKIDGFSKEKTAYEDFKTLFIQGEYSNESMLQEVHHYAEYYHTFMNGDEHLSDNINRYLAGLRKLKQTTVFLFLFHVFDDYEDGVIDQAELEKVLQLLLSYSVRRLMCEISSNSLRGMYKTLYGRVFQQEEYKAQYYDSVVSFMQQMTSRDVIPADDDFRYSLIHNNLYQKHALCRYLLIEIENQGKEKVQTDNLSIEHVMPQNKNLSTAWQKMLGANWAEDKEKWLHTLGNLTLTGYNSELGDKPFAEKKELIEDNQTKIVNLYQDIQSATEWNADKIQTRAKRLQKDICKLFPIIPPTTQIVFKDPRYKEYTAEEPKNATNKVVSYYELLGERVNVDSYADMLRSVANKMYAYDGSVIERMARTDEKYPDWMNPAFSYNEQLVKHDAVKLRGTEIYLNVVYPAADIVTFIRELLKKYDLDITEDFIYGAREH